MKPSHLLIAVCVLLTALLAPGVPAAAKVQRTFDIYARDHDPGLTPGLPDCPGNLPPCEFTFTGTVTYLGPDLEGTGEYVLYFREGLDGKFHYHGYTNFYGRVNHCGTGHMTILYENGSTDPLTRESRDDWSIEPGSGDEDLVGISGSGFDVIKERGDTGTDGEVFGKVTCEPEKGDRRATLGA